MNIYINTNKTNNVNSLENMKIYFFKIYELTNIERHCLYTYKITNKFNKKITKKSKKIIKTKNNCYIYLIGNSSFSDNANFKKLKNIFL